MGLVTCEDCGRQVSDKAVACPQCGRPMSPVVPAPPPPPPEPPREIVVEPSPGVAAVLSFLLPGLGQIYRGKVGAGLVWLLVVACGYALLIIPGIVAHLACVFDAATRSTPNRGARSLSGTGTVSPSPVAAPEGGRPGTVLWATAKLRQAPSATAPIVEHLPQHTPLQVYEARDGWVRVFVTGLNVRGWLLEKAVEKQA